jgi:hypothetical protein
MIEYYYQNLGASVAIGIAGDSEEEILNHFNGFFNFGATKKEPKWITDGRLLFFSTNEKKLLQCLRNQAEMKMSLTSNLDIDEIVTKGSPKVINYYEKMLSREVAARRANIKPKTFLTVEEYNEYGD